jgi:hypothetical protein
MLLQAMLYGAQKDKNFLAYSLDALVPDYSKRWKLSINSQEALYIRSLAVLLRSGLSVASEAITYMFPLKAAGNISSVDVTPMDLNLSIPPLRLHDTYQVSRCYHALSLITSCRIIPYQIIYVMSCHIITLSNIVSSYRAISSPVLCYCSERVPEGHRVVLVRDRQQGRIGTSVRQ